MGKQATMLNDDGHRQLLRECGKDGGELEAMIEKESKRTNSVDSDGYSGLDIAEEASVITHLRSPSRSWRRISDTLSLVFFAISTICLLVSALVYTEASRVRNKAQDEYSTLVSTVFVSPITAATKIHFGPTKWVSPPLSNYTASIYRQPPSPAVDAEWDRISDIGTHLLTTEDILRLGKDPTKAAKVPESWGYGSDAHMATIDGIHLVHCLNTMRQNLHLNFDYYHPDPLGPEYLPHLTHCVEALVKHLMCSVSLEPITQNWIERQSYPFPDFAVNKKCWDYEAVLRWKDQHRVRDIESRYETLVKPDDVVAEPLPPLVAETWDVIDTIRAKAKQKAEKDVETEV